MPAERKLVYKLDEGMATGGEPQELHIILWDGVFGGSPGTPTQVRSGRSQGVSFVELTIDRAKWHREIYRDARHRDQSLDPSASGGTETQSLDRQVDQGSDPSRSSGMPEVDHPGQRVGESVLEREVQRGHDPLFYRSPGFGSGPGPYEIWWQYGDPKTGMLRYGRLNQAMVAGYVTLHSGRGRFLTEVFDRQGRLQVSTYSGPETPYDGQPTGGASNSPGEGVL